jgi:hypothetical protein
LYSCGTQLARVERALLNLTPTCSVQCILPLFLSRPISCKYHRLCQPGTQDRDVSAFTCQGGAGTPWTLIARSPANSLHDMRICALETHSCPTDSTSLGQGLDFGTNYTPRFVFTICPRPAICRRCVCCFSSAQQLSLDLIGGLLARPAYRASRAYVCSVFHRTQRTPTWCSAHSE